RLRSWNCPRPVGPSQRAVMIPFTRPIAIMAPWPLSTWSASAAKWRRFGPLAMYVRSPRRRQRIERVSAGAQHRLSPTGEVVAPERRYLGLEGLACRAYPFLFHRHVRRAQLAGRRVECGYRVDLTIVHQPLLEIAEQHEGAFDVVGMGYLLEHEDPSR